MSIGRCDPAIAQSVFPVVSRRSTRETKKRRAQNDRETHETPAGRYFLN